MNFKDRTKLKIAISKMEKEENYINRNLKFINKKIAIVACAFLLITSSVTFASISLIRYYNGKPVIFSGEEISEELEGKEVVIAVPDTPSKPDYITQLNNILSKYYDSFEVTKICNEAQKDGLGNEDKITSEGGIKLYHLIYNIFKEKNVTIEDKEKVLEYLEKLDKSEVNTEEINTEILLELFPTPQEEFDPLLSMDLESKALILQMETGKTFNDVLYKYYNKEELDDLYEKINLERNSISDLYGKTENSEKLIQYMIDLLKNENITDDEKILLDYGVRKTIVSWNIDNEDIREQISLY